MVGDNGEDPVKEPVMKPSDLFQRISHGQLERVQTYLLVLMKRFQCPLEAYDAIMDWAKFATSEPSFYFSQGSVGNKQGSVVAALTKKWEWKVLDLSSQKLSSQHMQNRLKLFAFGSAMRLTPCILTAL